MLSFVLKRIAYALFIIWGVLTAMFLLIRLAPGDPTFLYISPDFNPEVIEQIRIQMGLHLPIWQQYITWLPNFISGNFGNSFAHHRSVIELLSEAIPNTLQLSAIVLVLQFILGITLGMLIATYQKSKIAQWLDKLILVIYSLPGFWVAIVLILIFSVKLGWLPSSQMSSIGAEKSFGDFVIDRLRHLTLPVIVLVLPFAANTARFIKDTYADVLQKDYIRTAHAYGLPASQIYLKYALKNALIPVATLAGMYFPFLLSGAVVTEYIFSWPGMGQLAIGAIYAHDYPVILACTFIAAAGVVVGNLLSDILYVLIDPRIKLSEG